MIKRISVLFFINLAAVSCCVAETDIKALTRDADRILRAGLRDKNDRIRANAIEVVSQTHQSELMGEVAALMKDPSIIVRFAAATAIGDMNYTPATDQLKQSAKDPDLNVVLASNYALYKLGHKKSYKVIEQHAMSTNQTVRANAAMLLGKLGKKESLPILYKIKDNSESTNTAAFNATESIARIGDEKIYKKIWTMLISVYADDRYMGAHAMAAFGGTRGANALVTLLEDEIPEVRLTAAEQLATLGDMSGKSVVQDYFIKPPDDKAALERCNAMAALAIGQIGDPQLAGYLPRLLQSESPFVQLAAAKSVLMLDKAR